MSYVQKPGSLSLFKNEKKITENHPDYTGAGLDLQGRPVWVSAWVKRPEGKKPFFSISITLKEDQEPNEAEKSLFGNDDLPF